MTSLVKVRKTPLIVLHVTFMEMNSQAAREVGSELGLSFVNQNFSFALGGNNNPASGSGDLLYNPLGGTSGNWGTFTNNPGRLAPNIFQWIASTTITPPTQTVNSVTGALFTQPGSILYSTTPSLLGVGQPATAPGLLQQANLFGIPGGAAFSLGSLQNVFTALSTINTHHQGTWTLNPSLQAVISHSRARVLAEPTLVTISGERIRSCVVEKFSSLIDCHSRDSGSVDHIRAVRAAPEHDSGG